MDTTMQKFRFAVQNALNLHRMTWAAYWSLPIGLGICLAALGLSVFSPDSAELAQSVIMQAGVIGSMFGVFGLLAVAAAAVHQSWRHTWRTAPDADHIPDAGKNALPMAVHSIAPDVLVWRKQDESAADFADRIARSKQVANDAVWVVVCPYRSQVVTVVQDGGKTLQFSRGNEPFQTDLKEAEHLPDAYDCTAETQSEYHRYLGWFCAHWRKYSEVAKVAERAGIGTVIKLARVSACVVFLFFSVGISAQSKARQVDEALGTRIREIPSAGVRIEFEFREGNKTRTYLATGNGQRDYVELLQHCGTGLARYNDEGGTLVAVRKNGEVVARGAAQGSAATSARPVVQYQFQPSETGDPVRPRGLYPNQSPAVEPESFDMPDSMQIAERLEQAKEEITGWKAEMWRSFTPVWEFLMWLFSSVLVLLICAICVLRYIAKTAANESLVSVYGHVIAGRWIVSIQQNSAAMTLIFVWSIAVVLLINLFLWMTYAGWSIWAMIPAAALVGWFAERVTDWIVPDLRVVQNNGRGITPY